MILVTGATGLLGSHLLYELISNGESCVALCHSKSKILQVTDLFKFYNPTKADEYLKKITWKEGDLLDIFFLKELFNGITHVYHCAAKVSFFKADFSECMRQNREATANVVNFCLKYKVEKLCYVSSTAAIGNNPKGLTTESDKWEIEDNNSGYSISKFSAEKEVWRGIEEGLSAVIINPCVILGPGNWESGSLSIFKTGKKGLLFYPSGSNATVDARDVAFCMRHLMNSNIQSERFLCVGTNQSFKDLFTNVCSIMKSSIPKYQAPKSIALFFATILEFFSRFSGKKSGLSVETVHSAYKNISYDVSKIKVAVPVKFKTLQETVENVLKARTNQ
ncbi:MAG: NAD-dependent epimerase/dehydratase family protein [Flavobacteriales bacterium]|nr:NAD-dependent epimerase/dehydratase family protein [Flavobacteriales bacterium]